MEGATSVHRHEEVPTGGCTNGDLGPAQRRAFDRVVQLLAHGVEWYSTVSDDVSREFMTFSISFSRRPARDTQSRRVAGVIVSV